MLQPVQRRLSGESATGLAEHGSESRIVAQLIVIDHVLVAEREPEDALAQEIGDGARNAVGEPQFAEALAGRSVKRIERSAAPSNSAPPFDVIAPPSKAPTSLRPPQLPKSSSSWLHCVGIGSISSSVEGVAAQQLSLSRSPDAPHIREKVRLVAS